MKYQDFFQRTGVSKGNLVEGEFISKFEEENNIILPPKYKDFLIDTNGGRPLFTSFIVQDFYEVEQIIILELFYDFLGFIKELREIKSQKDYTFIDYEKIGMIGRCRMREFIFIGIAEDNFGKIYFAPEENVTDFVSEDNDSGIYPIFEIAPDLDSFFTMLKHPGEFDPSYYE